MELPKTCSGRGIVAFVVSELFAVAVFLAGAPLSFMLGR